MSLLHVGLDVGSTTAKTVILDEDDQMIHSHYRRHFADIPSTVREMMGEIRENYGSSMITMAVAGSGALSLAEGIDVSFAQELVACSASVGRYLPGVDVCIELGGEDAKLTFFDQAGADQRMNETCAGGTGAFIDQMASLLGTDASGLNDLAKGYKTIYPIASRCGVFAKTDIQPLLNDGASKQDIAASIFQAIVNQTISGLACGRRIAGNVAFLGGPLYFLPELRKRFAETLCLSPGQCVVPENPHLFVAIGAAILGKKGGPVDMAALHEKAVKFFSSGRRGQVNVLPTLFASQEARDAFRKRHSAGRVAKKPLDEYRGDAFLGIDVGSTTTKVVLTGSAGELLFWRYRVTGGGEPLTAVREILLELYEAMPEGVRICRSGVTGYGEKLVQAAMGIDVGEVETVVHARAAEFVLPGVDFVIDIGGQDMKCLGVKDGVVRRVFLNEACSSGCGSFLQSLAESLEMDLDDFAEAAAESTMPVDLGSRCTVFMNSRVRQAQKEGANVRDISAGLAYAVVRNALYKVLKLRDADELGRRIVVQGGTFKNDALLRAFELLTGREVVRPEIPELMGAFGAALLARDTYSGQTGTTIGREGLEGFCSKTSTARCGGCGNRCILTRTLFSGGKGFVSGNRCEQGASLGAAPRKSALPPNLFERKYKRLFSHYEPLPASAAPRGVIGIPRVLNMYENYPLWFTLFTGLGFRVELSSAAPPEHMGMDTIPSQTLCYPAKLAHRHIADLLSRGIKRIFYPVVLMEKEEFADAHQHFNCPVVTGYPDVAFLNIDELCDDGVLFMRQPMPIDSPKRMARALSGLLAPFGVSKGEIKAALGMAYEEARRFKEDVESYGREALEAIKDGTTGIVLSGHPYHLDPEVNHGIPELINGYGVAVFTEDSVCWMADETGEADPLYVVDQWVYHSRLYRTAAVVARHPAFRNVQMVQLNSFGCGLDAISADQSADLLERQGRLHTLIKIDEGKNNGAVKIRIRSLLAAVRMGHAQGAVRPAKARVSKQRRASVRPDASRTILCPPLSTHHFQFLEIAMREAGLNFEVLPEGGRETAELALKHVNNDACYPSMVVIGQFLEALQSGRYDPETTDCLYAQTGGACRASNYVPLLRRALDSAGFSQVRVLAANAQGNSGAEAFSVPAGTVWRSLLGLMYGDLLMRLSLRTRPYEIERGSADRLYRAWAGRCKENVIRGGWRRYVADVRGMTADFAALPINPAPRPRVGIVGEILVKYHANANEKLVEVIEAEGGEAVVPDLAGFMSYCLYDPVFANAKLSGKFLPRLAGQAGISALEFLKRPIAKALKGTRFGEPHDIYGMAELAGGMVSLANQAGEGWLLSAEMMRLIESGVNNVLCIQPFACLPNHVTGKGVMKELKRRYRGANILALDYDISVSNVNQLNRIKLLMATARCGNTGTS
ncbi:MAG: acyl-CoA dehydratase activase [Synergistaceae bacterium]|jgi:predicted CoA-substrate-specific enzyme activase|nr:acyl-CoA dehydratase activase [Synergistaceae bacterium]